VRRFEGREETSIALDHEKEGKKDEVERKRMFRGFKMTFGEMGYFRLA